VCVCGGESRPRGHQNRNNMDLMANIEIRVMAGQVQGKFLTGCEATPRLVQIAVIIFRWRQQDPPKSWYPATRLHSVTAQKTWT
jgi:hypothetical protein